jgi:hypothetical protein
MTVTALCPGMSDTGFAKAARQKITPALKQLMMQPAPWCVPVSARCCARLGKQSRRHLYLGNGALAALSDFLSRYECMKPSLGARRRS